jgi:Transposase DDE domain
MIRFSQKLSQESLLMKAIIPEISEAMWRVLKDEADYAGRESGFIKRKRKLSGASFVQSLVFGYLANPSATTDEIRQAAATLDIDITRQGLDKRFTPESANCLKLVLEATVKEVFKAKPVAVDILKRFESVHLFDSSRITLPDSLSGLFEGCGGSVDTNTQASLKICVDFDLLRGALDGPLLQAGREHDRQALSRHQALKAGSLWIADLAYFKLDEFEQMELEKRYYLSRLKTRTKLFTVDGEPLDLVTCLKSTSANEIDRAIKLGKTHRLSCRLIAVRVPKQVAQQRRKRLREQARKSGRVVSRERLALVHWTIYVTNVPPALLSVEEALVLGRSRWQVEMLFKLWKSDGQIDESRSENPWHILTEFYAKMIAMVIQHWLFLIELWDHPERSLHQASQVIKKHAFHLASVFHRVDELHRAIQTIQRCLAGCRMTKCKSKRHTYELWLKFNL